MELRYRGRTLSAIQPGERPQPSVPAGTDLLPQIKHIVVLMMENHSYDNYLGMLSGRGEGFPLDDDGAPAATNLDAEGSPVRAHHLATTTQRDDVPCQSWHASQQQWNQGKMDGFVTSAQDVAPDADPAVGMGYWSQEDLPFYYGLARAFPLADRWFSSCLGPTFPNRRFLIAGTANGLVDDLPFHLLDYPPNGTIFDMLTRHDISWANYHPVGGGKSRARLQRFSSPDSRAGTRTARRGGGAGGDGPLGHSAPRRRAGHTLPFRPVRQQGAKNATTQRRDSCHCK